MSKASSTTTTNPATPVRDPRALRALAHPLRWSLIEVLISEKTATATRCAQILAEPVNSCSFHLRTLEKYGFIERVVSSERREHPWRLVDQQVTWDSPGDTESSATDELNEMLIEREAQRQRTFLRTRSDLPLTWQRAAAAHGAYRWMTAAELRAFTAEIEALFDRYCDRREPALRPRGARLVRLVSVALPVPRPANNET